MTSFNQNCSNRDFDRSDSDFISVFRCLDPGREIFSEGDGFVVIKGDRSLLVNLDVVNPFTLKASSNDE